MTEKVKLTQGQAHVLEELKIHYTLEQIIKTNIRGRLQKEHFNYHHMKLADESVDTLIRALYIGYEVESEFKVGDWVVREKGLNLGNFKNGKIFKIKCVIKSALQDELLAIDNDDNSEHLFRNIRHATPEEIAQEKERRFFAKHGRKPWELRVNDLLINRKGEIHRVTKTMDGIHIEFDHIPLYAIKKHFQIVCFAEGRKDIEQ